MGDGREWRGADTAPTEVKPAAEEPAFRPGGGTRDRTQPLNDPMYFVRAERASAAAQIDRSLKAWRKSAQAGTRPAAIPVGGGAPLDSAVRGTMQTQLGADLGAAKIHTGTESAQAAEALGARAFTVGQDVHFGGGQFAPGTKEGDRLLAHELTHVVQGQKSGVQRKADDADAGAHGAAGHEVSQPGEPAEQEADRVADGVADQLHGHSPGASSTGKAAGADTRAGGGDAKQAMGHPAAAPEGEKSGAAKAEEKPAKISAKFYGVGRKLFRSVNDQKGSKPKIDRPVPGLYGQLDPQSTPAGWQFIDTWMPLDPMKPSLIALRTEVTDPQGKFGFVERGYDTNKKQFVMLNAFLIRPGADKGTGVQSMIEHKDPVMIIGRGTPTQTFLTLRQMKLLERKAGMDVATLEKVKMSTIQNIEGICQLNQALRSGAKAEDLMANNESKRYAETTLTQVGKKIKSAKVVGGHKTPFKGLLEHYERGDQKKRQNFDKQLQQYGLTRDDVVLWNYDVELEVMPWPKS